MRKSKGYAKGGAKMMKARGGKMAKGYAKGGAKMMKARGGKMAKGYAKGGAKMMKAMGGRMASKGGRKMMKAMGGKMAKGYMKGGPFLGVSMRPEYVKKGKSKVNTRAMTTKAKNASTYIKTFNEMVGKLPLPVSRKAVIKKGIKKLVMPAMKNLGTVKPSKVKTIKSVRGLKKK